MLALMEKRSDAFAFGRGGRGGGGDEDVDWEVEEKVGADAVDEVSLDNMSMSMNGLGSGTMSES